MYGRSCALGMAYLLGGKLNDFLMADLAGGKLNAF